MMKALVPAVTILSLISSSVHADVDSSRMTFEVRECYEVFQRFNYAEWRDADTGPASALNSPYCDTLVDLSGRVWIGDAETRRIAEEKRQAEEEELRRIAEAERKKKEEEERKRREELRKLLADYKEEAARYETAITSFLASTPNPSVDEVEIFFSAQSELRNTLKAKSSQIKSYGEEVLIPKTNYGPLPNIYIKQRVDIAFAEDGNLWRALETSFGRLAGYGIPESAVTEFPVDIIFAKFNEKNESEIKFPIDLNLANLSGVQASLGKELISADQVFEALEKSSSQYRVLIDLSEQSVARDVTSQEVIDSQYVVGEELVPNPAYRGAQMRYYEVKEMWDYYNDQQAACNTKCVVQCCIYCWKICNLAKEWQGRHRVARQEFLGVKEWIKTPVYQSYQFRQTNISVSKSATVTAYLVNADSEVIAQSTKEFSDEQEFSVLYGRHQEDKRKKYFENHFAVEGDALKFAEAAISLEVSELLQGNIVLKEQSEEFINVKELVSSLGKTYAIEDNVVLEDSEAISTGETDKRFDSVVVVLHPDGSIGSGFFVTPEIILTNYHVVEGTEFPEIVKFDGLEGAGQVIAKDIRRDLALVKVDISGVPVTLAPSNKVNRGATVEAIGHPEGLEFSLTRGAVSGVRRLPSLYDPGGSKIRFVQSDVAVNPGNSGGPLFEGAYVIGVNDWKLAATQLEGLSFAIHISEVRKFLKKHGI